MDTMRGLPRSLSSRADLNLMKLLVALLDTRSVTAAGALLNLTQSAASSALKRLRDLCGDPLFVRTPRGMEPTPFALRFGEDVRTALKTLDASFARQTGFDPAHAARGFRLALSDVGEYIFLPALIGARRRALRGAHRPGDRRAAYDEGRHPAKNLVSRGACISHPRRPPAGPAAHPRGFSGRTPSGGRAA
jgi:DNA-binding transcriptional LysR family regulator